MPAKTRVNITIDRETLRLADREARRQKVSRSEFVRAVVRRAASEQERESKATAQRKRRLAAIEGIRRIAQQLGDWPAEQIVHDWRYRLKGDKK